MSAVMNEPPSANTLLEIKEQHRRRQDFLNAEGALARQIKAIERRIRQAHYKALGGQKDRGQCDCGEGTPCADVINGAVAPLVIARESPYRARMEPEKRMKKLAESLPVYTSFVDPIVGFGALGLAQIIGECGDLSNYSNPAKVWKRMGLGLVDGERQRKCTDPEKALAHGYSPRRRSTMYVLGDSLLKKQNAYRELYLARKVYEIQKAEAAGKTVKPAASIPEKRKDEFMSAGHVHRRAQRYVEKRLLRDLWRAWRGRFLIDTQQTNAS